MSTFQRANHATDPAKFYKVSYGKGERFDVTLIAESDGTRLGAHYGVLYNFSDYIFEKYQYTKGEPPKNIELANVNGMTLKSILDYIYFGSIDVDRENVKSILMAAGLLKMKILINACCGFILKQKDRSFCLDIVVDIVQLTMRYDDKSLIAKSSQEFAYQHLDRIYTEEAFLSLDEEELKNFLSGDLHAAKHGQLFNCLVAWYRHDKNNRKELMSNLVIQYIQFKLLEGMPIVLEWNLSSEVPECETLVSFDSYLLKEFGENVSTYNSLLEKWSQEKWPKPPIIQNDYTAICFGKKLFLSGGTINDCITNRVQYLDLESKIWGQIAPLKAGRGGHAIAEVNSNLYIVGGMNGQALTSVEKYNFTTGMWRNESTLPKALAYCSATGLNGSLYVVGDQNLIMKYNTSDNKWSQIKHTSKQVFLKSITAVNDCLYMLGFWDKSTLFSANKYATLEEYNPTTNTFTEIKDLRRFKNDNWSHCIAWNRLLLVFGQGGVIIQFDIKTRKWKSLPKSLACTKPPNGYSLVIK